MKNEVVKDGYKATDVGVIPNDWEVTTLENIANIIDPQPDHRTPPELDRGEPYIGISDFLNETLVDWDNCRKIIPKAVDKQQASFYVSPGDIVFGKIGTIGVPKFVPTTTFRYALSANVILIKPKIPSYFLMAWLKSSLVQKHIYQELHSTSQAAFGILKMRKLPIALPSLHEQKNIAEVLSDVDNAIASLEKLISKKRHIKQGATQQLLTGKKRLSGFTEKWKIKTIGELCEISAGGDLNKDQFSTVMTEPYVYPIYSNSHSNFGLYGFSSYFQHEGNAVTVTARGDVGFAVARFSCFVAIGRLLILKPLKNIDCQFLSEFINEFIDFANESTGVPQLTAPQIAKYEISLPSKQEQEAIAEVLTDMDNEIVVLEEKLNKTRQLKQGMMQELLTGRIRLI